MPTNIPHRIKTRRKALALSQADLAQACGVGQSTVANWERGGHIPRQATLHKIAEALQTDELWLLSGERANSRGPLNTYLSRPIKHVAIFDWPANKSALNTAHPRNYIAVTTEHENLFALVIEEDHEGFKAGTVLVFTPDYNATEDRKFLDITDITCALTTTHSATCTARLVYSVSPH